jgi:hypothetical protein
VSKRRDNPISRTAWIVGGAVAAAVAAVGVGVLVHNAQAAAAPSSPGNPPAGVVPGSTVTLNAAAGNSSALISTQNALNIATPTGSTVQNVMADGQTVNSPNAGQPTNFGANYFTTGQHAITISWTDSSGAAQVSNITLTVTA